MLPGIEVLAQQTIHNSSTGGIIGGAIFATVFGIVAIVYLVLAIIKDIPELCILTIAFALSMFVIGHAVIDSARQESYVEYKVLIADDVSWQDFNAQYEVLDQEGKIYTIKEK